MRGCNLGSAIFALCKRLIANLDDSSVLELDQ